MVAERQWLDFISYCGGLPMFVLRVWPDEKVQAAIFEAAAHFELRLQSALERWRDASADMIQTERLIEQEMYING